MIPFGWFFRAAAYRDSVLDETAEEHRINLSLTIAFGVIAAILALFALLNAFVFNPSDAGTFVSIMCTAGALISAVAAMCFFLNYRENK